MFRALQRYAVQRAESRIPMELRVQISGHPEVPGVETTFTQDVSSGGARVLTSRRWRPNDMLVLASAAGGFRSPARVAYCRRAVGEGFAIGLEILEPGPGWVVQPPAPL